MPPSKEEIERRRKNAPELPKIREARLARERASAKEAAATAPPPESHPDMLDLKQKFLQHIIQSFQMGCWSSDDQKLEETLELLVQATTAILILDYDKWTDDHYRQ